MSWVRCALSEPLSLIWPSAAAGGSSIWDRCPGSPWGSNVGYAMTKFVLAHSPTAFAAKGAAGYRATVICAGYVGSHRHAP